MEEGYFARHKEGPHVAKARNIRSMVHGPIYGRFMGCTVKG